MNPAEYCAHPVINSLDYHTASQHKRGVANEMDLFSDTHIKKEIITEENKLITTTVNADLELHIMNSSSNWCTVDNGASSILIDKQRAGLYNELAVVQADLERIKAENQRLRSVLDMVNNKYHALEMHIATLVRRDHENTKPDQQVQRCTEDGSIVITSYEGNHNHPLSAAAMSMASTTSAAAAASMLLSGSITSASTSTSTSSASHHQYQQQLFNHYNISSNAFPPPTISASPHFPTVTLDLTNNINTTPNINMPHINNFASTTTTTAPAGLVHSSDQMMMMSAIVICA